MRIWFEKGIKAKPKTYELEKLFSPFAFTSGLSSNSQSADKYNNDMRLLSKFYHKYPEVKYFP